MRAWTQYWSKATVDALVEPNSSEGFDHSASDRLGERGIEPGDRLYILTCHDNTLFVLTGFTVERIVVQSEAEKLLKTCNLWDASYHAIAREPGPPLRRRAINAGELKRVKFYINTALGAEPTGIS